MNQEEKKFVKKEPIVLKRKYLNLLLALKKKRNAIDERTIKLIAKKNGFKTSDEKVFKLIAAIVEFQIDDLLTSINHKNKKSIENIRKKFQEAKDDNKMSRKKFQNIHNQIMAQRVLTLKEVLLELKEQNQFAFFSKKLPTTTLDKIDEQIDEQIDENQIQLIDMKQLFKYILLG